MKNHYIAYKRIYFVLYRCEKYEILVNYGFSVLYLFKRAVAEPTTFSSLSLVTLFSTKMFFNLKQLQQL